MLPDRYVESVSKIITALRRLGNPVAPFDPNDPKHADLKAWIAPSVDPAMLAGVPTVRIATGQMLELADGGKSVDVYLDKPLEIPNDAFPSARVVPENKVPPRPPVVILNKECPT